MAAKVMIEVPPQHEAAMRQFLALATEMEQLALAAPDGQVLQVCEEAVLQKGRPLLAQTLTRAVARRIEAAEKKGPRSASVTADDQKKTAAPNNAS
jgi:hypothetical protein